MNNLYILVIFLVNALKFIDCEWWDTEDEQAKLFFDDGPARIRDFPHIVSIAVQVNKDTASLLCTGTYLTTYEKHPVILTAGSCVKSILEKVDDTSKVYVRTNSEYWNCQCGIGRTYSIFAAVIHPEYTEHVLPFIGAFSENDIGMIALNGTWEGVYNELAAKFPVQLGTQANWAAKRVLTLGWGYSEKSSSTTAELRTAESLLILSAEKCKMFYTEYFPNNSYCVGSEQTPGKGPCSHDQGAPMLIVTKTKVGYKDAQTVDIKFFLMGIASTAPRCGDPRKPTIVVNVTQYASFIQNLTWINVTVQENNKTGTFSELSGLVKWSCQLTDKEPQEFICCKELPKFTICFGWQPGPNGKIWFYGETQDGVEDVKESFLRQGRKPSITGIRCKKSGVKNTSKCCASDSYVCFKWQQYSATGGTIWWSFPGNYNSWWSGSNVVGIGSAWGESSFSRDNNWEVSGNWRKRNYLNL